MLMILCEKPSQCLSYVSAMKKSVKKDGYYEVEDPILGGKAIFTYGFGHLVELAPPEKYDDSLKQWKLDTLPILPKKYQYQVGEGKSKQFNIVKRLLNSNECTEIVVGTDADREGELIAYLIINQAKASHKKISRLWINSLEPDEIRKGFANLRDGKEFYNSYIEAQTRQISDWLVGMNASRLYTLLLRQQGLEEVVSIGRVQTPTLFLIYQREQEIKNFKPEKFYEVEAIFTKSTNEIYIGKLNKRFTSVEELFNFFNSNGIDIREKNPGIVTGYDIAEKETKSPKLYALSDLQSEANRLYKISAADTLKTMQNLYEAKLLSYPRTDSNYITEAEYEYLKSNLNGYLKTFDLKIDNNNFLPDKRYVNNKNVQEHYAIIPTKRAITPEEFSQLGENEKKIYELVLRRTLAMFATTHKYNETVITTSIKDIDFRTIGRTITNIGWKSIISEGKTAGDEKPNEIKVLPSVFEGEKVLSDVKGKEGLTKPPKLFTEGTLISAMKNIGKQAESEEDKEILKKTEGIGTEATRANVIETLKNQKYIVIQKNNIAVTEKGNILCEVIKDREISKPELTAKWENYLKKIHEGKGTQDTFLNSIENFIKYLIKIVPGDINTNTVTEKIKDKSAQDSIGNCPKCNSLVKEKLKVFSCSNDDCNFVLYKKVLNKSLTAANAKMLLKGRKTKIIKGLQGKNNKSFDAMLVLNDDGTTRFVFS